MKLQGGVYLVQPIGAGMLGGGRGFVYGEGCDIPAGEAAANGYPLFVNPDTPRCRASSGLVRQVPHGRDHVGLGVTHAINLGDVVIFAPSKAIELATDEGAMLLVENKDVLAVEDGGVYVKQQAEARAAAEAIMGGYYVQTGSNFFDVVERLADNHKGLLVRKTEDAEGGTESITLTRVKNEEVSS